MCPISPCSTEFGTPRWASFYTISGVDFNGVLCDSSMWHHLFQMLYRHHFALFLEHISMAGHVKMPNKAKVVIPCVVDNMGIILHHFLCTFQWQDYAWENANQSQICDTMCYMQYGHISNHSWCTFQWHGMWQEDVTLKCEIVDMDLDLDYFLSMLQWWGLWHYFSAHT